MTGLFLTDYSVYGFLPKILTLDGRGFDTTTYSLIYGFALFLSFLGYNFYGWMSDRTGRKILTQYYCVFLIVFGIPGLLRALSRRSHPQPIDGCPGHVMAGNAEARVGRGSGLSLRTLPNQTSCRRCGFRLFRGRDSWSLVPVRTYCGRTRSLSSAPSRGRTRGCLRR